MARPSLLGRYDLDLTFTGTLNDKLHGFYRSQYSGPDGETRYMAATQFEATDARRAFPCWDEPECKAVFQVTLAIPAGLQAISNTPVEQESQPRPGVTELRFAETPVMSTYLLAFVVGDLTAIHGQYQGPGGPTQVSVWTTPGKEEQGRFALDTSVSLLTFFNDYFGIPYPLEKLDHIALPDFAAGAMENWGAITYREVALLVDEANSSAGTRQRVAEVVAHEMAHMWFGDLVTMQWWDDLWLNESFASWMGTKAVDWLFPEWEMWTQFVNMDTTRALSLDGLKNSHPIEQEVENPAEVSQLFDAISYSKGCLHHQDAGAIPGGRHLPQRPPAVHRLQPVRQRPHPGPVVCPGVGLRAAGYIHHGYLDQADGIPGAAGRGLRDSRRTAVERLPGKVRLRPAAGRPRPGAGGMASAHPRFPWGRRTGDDGDGRPSGQLDIGSPCETRRRPVVQDQPPADRLLPGQLPARGLGPPYPRHQVPGTVGRRPAGNSKRCLFPVQERAPAQ